MMRLRSIVLALALLGAPPALAVQPDEVLADPALEARARALSKELRCMVCQNQSIDDSDAPLARDLRLLVRERLTAGDSDAKVIEYLTARYGEFVLLKPRFGAGTALLWFTPLIALIAGGWLVVVALRRRRADVESPGAVERGLSEADRARVAELMRPPGK
jgi:cytochrome c-type biogenesis protein CcmH